jgi:hypothetical protein
LGDSRFEKEHRLSERSSLPLSSYKKGEKPSVKIYQGLR